MELTFWEKMLIQATRTISFAGPGVRVRWESLGLQGNGAGATLDEAYEQASREHFEKYHASQVAVRNR
jgi:hypothetical protein